MLWAGPLSSTPAGEAHCLVAQNSACRRSLLLCLHLHRELCA
jgi:hypothetical protein